MIREECIYCERTQIGCWCNSGYSAIEDCVYNCPKYINKYEQEITEHSKEL